MLIAKVIQAYKDHYIFIDICWNLKIRTDKGFLQQQKKNRSYFVFSKEGVGGGGGAAKSK